MSKQIQRRLKKSVTPAVIRYEVQIIIAPETKKPLTSIVFIFKQRTLSSPTQIINVQNLPVKEMNLYASTLTYLLILTYRPLLDAYQFISAHV